MLSIFPDMLTFWLVAPLLLRVSMGLIFIYFGVSKIQRGKDTRVSFFKKIGLGKGTLTFWIVSTLEIIGGGLLVLGLFTQLTALVLSIITMGALYIKIRRPKTLKNTPEFFILLLAALLSLVFLGPGFIAVDLPL